MEFFQNCISGNLNPYSTPLDLKRVLHLYRRAAFSCTVETAKTNIGAMPTTLVDSLVDAALAMPTTPAPAWANWTQNDYPAEADARNEMVGAQKREWKVTYSKALYANNLRDRMSFFWHNHFVTQIGIYNCPTYMYHYTNMLQENALGNFKDFTHAVGLDFAMLFYLDGAYNSKNYPNENYARELYELFALGEGNNYTELDVQETSRAFTGYTLRDRENNCSGVQFDPTDFDNTSKTIFGQTGNWGYKDVIDILFAERSEEISKFICTKFYEFFVHPDGRAAAAVAIIDPLAAEFAANWEIAPIVRRLLKSEHFFDEAAIGVIIKSPFDLALHLHKEVDTEASDENYESIAGAYTSYLGQELFHPIEVEGWQRDRDWINTNFMIGRWLIANGYLEALFMGNDANSTFLDFGIQVADSDLGSSNPDVIARRIIDFVLPRGLYSEGDYQQAFAVFRRSDLEQYYEGSGDPNAGTWSITGFDSGNQVFELLKYLTLQPEYQLK